MNQHAHMTPSKTPMPMHACGRRGGGGCAPIDVQPLALPGHNALIVERYLSIRASVAPVPVRMPIM
ncbi:MAG: hypothetical protein ACOYBR_09765 [Fluviibacter sp.]